MPSSVEQLSLMVPPAVQGHPYHCQQLCQRRKLPLSYKLLTEPTKWIWITGKSNDSICTSLFHQVRCEEEVQLFRQWQRGFRKVWCFFSHKNTYLTLHSLWLGASSCTHYPTKMETIQSPLEAQGEECGSRHSEQMEGKETVSPNRGLIDDSHHKTPWIVLLDLHY